MTQRSAQRGRARVYAHLRLLLLILVLLPGLTVGLPGTQTTTLAPEMKDMQEVAAMITNVPVLHVMMDLSGRPVSAGGSGAPVTWGTLVYRLTCVFAS